MNIKLGYEVGTGIPFLVKETHTVVTGMTNQSGKTTCLETMVRQSDLKSIVFKTKPSESVFQEGHVISPYFAEQSNWQYVEALLEATMKERMKFERSWIIKASKGTRTLREVYENCKEFEKTSKGLQQSVYSTLVAYFELVLPELDRIRFSQTLELKPGVNIMDLENISEQVQSLIIRSVLEALSKLERNTISVIPEAWLFIPQDRGNPVKLAAEYYIRQGATKKNWLFFDSQDLASIDKAILKQVGTYIMGLQLERNEVSHSLDQIPLPRKSKPTEDEIMSLTKGQFIVCTPGKVTRVYVQPYDMDDITAIRIARGEMSVDDWVKPDPIKPKTELYVKVNDTKVTIPFYEERETVPFESLLPRISDLQEQINTLKLVLGKVEDRVINLGKSPPIDIDKIIKEVLKQIPTGNGAVYTVAPLEMLKKEFLEETKTKILQDVQGLSEDSKKMLKYLESVGRGVKANELVEKCYMIKSGGSAQKKINDAFSMVQAASIARKDTAGRYYGELRNRILNMLETHGAAQQDVDALYNHVIYHLLQYQKVVVR